MMKKCFVLILLTQIGWYAFSQQMDGAARIAKLLNKAKMTSGSSGQQDDPESRAAFEILRLQDPTTGQIPQQIHARERVFFETHLQRQPLKSKHVRVADNLITWKNRGPYNVGGRTRALAIDLTNENVIIAGGVSGGMWRSADGGDSWVKATGSNDLQSATAVAQDPRSGHTNTWYYTTGENDGNSAGGVGAPYHGDGIFKSTDGGQSWTLLPSTSTDQPEDFDQDFDYNHEVVVSPVTGDVIVANYGGIYVSQDGGDSWSLKYAAPGSGGWSDVVVDDQGTIYAFVRQDGVIKSTDRGETWSNISSASFPSFSSSHRGEIALAPSNQSVLFLAAQTSSNALGHTLWKYGDSTGNWVDRSSNLPQEGGETGDFTSQGGYDLLIKVKPDDENVVFIGGVNLYRSTDGFASTASTDWIGGYESSTETFGLYSLHHPDQHCLVFYPSDPDRALSGNDGGIQLTNDITANDDADEPVSWTPLNNGYLTTQAYAVSAGPGDQVLAGFQDNGTWGTVSNDPEIAWENPNSGDGSYSAISSDGVFKYVSSQNANVYRIEFESGTSFSAVDYVYFSPENISSTLFISPLYLDRTKDDLFYMGGATQVYINTEAETGSSTEGWKTITLPNNTGRISEMGVVGGGTLYVGTSSGRLYKITDAQTSSPAVTDLTDPVFSGGYISGIGVNESNGNELIVTVSNYSVQSIFHSDDSGASWTHVSGNLEENTDGSGSGPSVRCVRILGDAQLYLVGTSVGLFTTNTLIGDNTTWEQENLNGLGSLVVEHMDTRNSDGLVVAGTHGNGIFSAYFPTSQTDLAVTAIDSPKSGLLSGTESIKAEVTNVGVDDISSFTLSYSVNGEELQTAQISQNITSGETYIHTFSNTSDFSVAGTYEVAVEVSVSGDQNISNDSFTKDIQSYARVDSFPYAESFETDDHGWTATNVWELGTPAKSALNSASDGVRAWATDLDDNYPNSNSGRLQSVVFDFSEMEFPAVSFDIAYDLEVDYDGVVLAYRTDLDSKVFKVIGNENELSNWYPSKAEVFGYKAWTGTTSGYVKASADLSFLAGEDTVQLAFLFSSDPLVDGEGFVMDNFRVFEDLSVFNEVDISDQSIEENNAINDVIGTFTTEAAAGEVIYSLVAGDGGDDNESFVVFTGQLLAAENFNYERKNLYSVRVRGEDENGHEFFSVFSIFIENVDDAPKSIQLSKTSIEEGMNVGVTLAEISVDDEDANETFTFSLFSGNGTTDNSKFGILQNELRTSARFDFEEKSEYIVRIKAESKLYESSITETFDISIEDVNEAPTDFTLSSKIIRDEKPAGSIVGNFSAEDDDGDDVSFSLVPGEGDDDNVSFSISGTQLITEEDANLGQQQLYRIRVEAADGKGQFLVSPFEITVEELLGLISLAKLGISVFPNPVKDQLNLKIANELYGASYMSLSTLEGKEVYRKDFQKHSDVSKEKINLQNLASGVYIMNFEIGGRVASARLVKK